MPGTTTTVVDAALAARMRLAVGRLARQLRRRSSAGLTLSQLSALASVEHLEPVRIGDLAAHEGVAAPTMTRIAAAMVEAGLCERKGSPADARSSLLSTTPSGRSALQSVREERTELLVTRLQALPPDQRESLADAVRLLEALVEGDDG